MNSITAIIATLTLASMFTFTPRKINRLPPPEPPTGTKPTKELPPPAPPEVIIIDQSK